MTYTFAYRRYTLPFRAPVRTAHNAWTQREGILVRLESETGNGRPLFGECAPIPWFGAETPAEAAATCAALGGRVTGAQLDAIGEKYPCLGFALESAKGRAKPPAEPFPKTPAQSFPKTPLDPFPKTAAQPFSKNAAQPEASPYLPVAALLPAGRAALEKIRPLSESGFLTFKWKVGVANIDDELALLDDILAALPPDARLRLDANGAWTRRAAERWLARCADYPIEFIEQPVAPAPGTGAAPGAGVAPAPTASASAAKNNDDLLLGLAADYPTPLALDESVATTPALRRWLQLGWPGVFVIKPSLLGDPSKILPALPPDRTVFSSALETAVGAQAALRTAFHFYAKSIAGFQTCSTAKKSNADSQTCPRAGEAEAGLETRATFSPRALGFGVWPLFRDARFDAPPAAPFIRMADLDTIKPEILWNALS